MEYKIKIRLVDCKVVSILSALVFAASISFAQNKRLDEINFGDTKSETKHTLEVYLSDTAHNELGDFGRRMLPYVRPTFQGGTIAFTMKVDPAEQNYLTVKCWGSEKDEAMVMLFINGRQVGYRHLGDIDLLHRGNGSPPALGRYYYITLPLPKQQTIENKEVRLELRSYGSIWDYGETFERYQKDMVAPTRIFYKAFTHTDPYFTEKGRHPTTVSIGELPLRETPGPEIIERLKRRVNQSLEDILQKEDTINQLESWFLADAYRVSWTVAYQNPKVVDKVAASIDKFYRELKENPDLIYSDNSIYNPDWLNAGPYAITVRLLWNQLMAKLDNAITIGDTSILRREAWSYIFKQHLNHSTTHRRHYTNQSMIIDWFMYEANRALMLINPAQALPEYQTLKYLYESLGMTPWLGKETGAGPEEPLGDNYWQLTDKGLTKELGFVGYYGEVLDWVVHLYEGTTIPECSGTGDAKIKAQMIKMMKARSYFRYPDADDEGYKAMRAEAVVGWRDGNHYPGNVLYGDRGIAWDATPLMTAANTLDPYALGMAQQMIEDNQFFQLLAEKMKLGGLRVTKSLLHIPDQYDFVKSQQKSSYRLPMSVGMPDFVFSDEENGVVAIKNGTDILYASLYWRARNAVNNLAKVHYITPEKQHVANIYVESEFEPSGMYFIRPGWVNLGFADWREFYPKDIQSAHTGEKLPIAKIPDRVKFKPGDENIYAGKADLYKMTYGNYFIVMNTSSDKTFEVKVPEYFQKGKILTIGENEGSHKLLNFMLEPQSTKVIFKK